MPAHLPHRICRTNSGQFRSGKGPARLNGKVTPPAAKLRSSQLLVRQQPLHPAANLVPDRSNLLNRQALGVLERPIVPAQTWDIWALVATTHGDEKLRVLCQLLGEFLRLCM